MLTVPNQIISANAGEAPWVRCAVQALCSGAAECCRSPLE
jgi:hypothetical protein